VPLGIGEQRQPLRFIRRCPGHGLAPAVGHLRLDPAEHVQEVMQVQPEPIGLKPKDRCRRLSHQHSRNEKCFHHANVTTIAVENQLD
jgi:hypothetical protein